MAIVHCMNISYNIRLEMSDEDSKRVISTLELQKEMWNYCSEKHFGSKKNSIKDLHSKCYRKLRKLYPQSPSQLVIRAEQECLSAYRSIKSNKQKVDTPAVKKRLSCRLDKRLYTFPSRDSIRFTVLDGPRVTAKFKLYPKVEQLINQYRILDPLLFVRNGKICLAVTFDIPNQLSQIEKLAIGVDLGKRNLATTSDGRMILGREYNRHKRQIRYLKRKLQSKGTSSAKRHLKKIRQKESDFSKNYIHHVANEILRTEANVIVLEDLTKVKKKKYKTQNKNSVSQVPFFLLRKILEYKAILRNKETLLRSPMYTSQKDYRGLKPGTRQGCRYLTSDGKIFHSDVNAANNIALKSKLPCLLVDAINSFIRQGVVSHPIVDTEIRRSRCSVNHKPLGLS